MFLCEPFPGWLKYIFLLSPSTEVHYLACNMDTTVVSPKTRCVSSDFFWLLCTLQGELFGQLGCDVHAILQPGQLGAGNAFCVAAQAGSDTRLPGLALWIHSDDGRNWNKVKESRRRQLTWRINTSASHMVVYISTTWAVRQPDWTRNPEQMVWHKHMLSIGSSVFSAVPNACR